jgi:hypothetical protein
MQDGYNTSLAAEFYVLSVLHRLGFHASLTLGNRKAIDIVVETETRTLSIDVKGMASRTNWPLDNFESENRPNHFIALVSFNNKIRDPSAVPTVFLVPARDVPTFFYTNPKGNRRTIPFRTMRDKGQKYRDAWHFLTDPKPLPRSTSSLPRRRLA